MHLVDRNQAETAAQARAQVRARLLVRRRRRMRLAPGDEGARTLQCRRKALGADRLHQVVDGGRLEGGQRVLVVGRAEHHRRPGIEGRQVAGGFQAIHAGHGDVEQHHVGTVLRTGLQRIQAVLGLGDHLDAGMFGEQRTQAFARKGFVVGDDHFHGKGVLDERWRDPPRPRLPMAAPCVTRRGRTAITTQTAGPSSHPGHGFPPHRPGGPWGSGAIRHRSPVRRALAHSARHGSAESPDRPCRGP